MIITEFRPQVVAIYPNKYEVLFNSREQKTVTAWAAKNRTMIKKSGALKVITNKGYYNLNAQQGEGDLTNNKL